MASRPQKVVIIIPTYNESLTIEKTLSELQKVISSIANFDIHVLVFDSASTDNTQKLVNKFMANNSNIHLLTEKSKTGLGSAYMQAMRYALSDMQADLIFEFDADLSHQPKYIEPMLLQTKNNDVVIGSRYVPGGSIPKEWSFDRKFLSVIGNFIARFMLTRKYKDFTSGFRVTKSSLLKQSLPQSFLSNQYAYKIQLLWLLHKAKAKIYEYPIEFIDRQKGQSKLPTNSIYDTLKVLFVLRLHELKGYLKMCLVGLSGLVIQLFIYNLLRQYLTPFYAQQIAVTVAILNNYLLNSRFTFKSKISISRLNKIKSLILFIGYSLLMIGLQTYWLDFGIKYLGDGSLKENLIIISGMFLGSLLNYLIYSRLIWRKKFLDS